MSLLPWASLRKRHALSIDLELGLESDLESGLDSQNFRHVALASSTKQLDDLGSRLVFTLPELLKCRRMSVILHQGIEIEPPRVSRAIWTNRRESCLRR